jgi:hypothetical protein
MIRNVSGTFIGVVRGGAADGLEFAGEGVSKAVKLHTWGSLVLQIEDLAYSQIGAAWLQAISVAKIVPDSESMKDDAKAFGTGRVTNESGADMSA